MCRKEIIAVGISLVFLAYLFGIATAYFQIFPYPLLSDMRRALDSTRENWRNDFGIEPTRHLNPARHSGDGVTVAEPDRMSPGVTLMTGLFENQIQARLVDPLGKVLHRWPIRYTELYPPELRAKDSYRQGRVTDWNVFVHGMIGLPDGSIVINFDGSQALARIDKCGVPIWRLSDDLHHSIHLAEDLTLWTPLDYRGTRVAQISLDGEYLQIIDLRPIIHEARMAGIMEILPATDADPYHINDVEPLPRSLGEVFPQFAPGDLVVSMRNANLIVVIDPDERAVRWWQNGPWRHQHDPDFLPDGRIGIFDNHTDYPPSRILAVDPQSRAIEVLYEGTDEDHFYTDIRGKQEFLPNGNILIVEAQSGRVVEITRQGDPVWEYVNRFDDSRIAFISNARRYPPGYFEVTDWSCPDD